MENLVIRFFIDCVKGYDRMLFVVADIRIELDIMKHFLGSRDHVMAVNNKILRRCFHRRPGIKEQGTGLVIFTEEIPVQVEFRIVLGGLEHRVIYVVAFYPALNIPIGFKKVCKLKQPSLFVPFALGIGYKTGYLLF